MHLWSTILIVLILLSDDSSSGVDGASCKRDNQCKVSQKKCVQCAQGKGPRCTTAICLNGQCATVAACSLQLNGKCKRDNDCISNKLCQACTSSLGPTCATGKCLNKKCALFQPCTVQLN